MLFFYEIDTTFFFVGTEEGIGVATTGTDVHIGIVLVTKEDIKTTIIAKGTMPGFTLPSSLKDSKFLNLLYGRKLTITLPCCILSHLTFLASFNWS